MSSKEIYEVCMSEALAKKRTASMDAVKNAAQAAVVPF